MAKLFTLDFFFLFFCVIAHHSSPPFWLNFSCLRSSLSVPQAPRLVATSLCPVGRLVCSEPCTGLLSIQRSSPEHSKHKEKEKTKRTFKRSQDNGYSTKGAQISSAYSFVILAILFAAPFHRSSKWLAARCLMASRFLPFRGCFGQALFSPFFASGFQNGAKECIV